MKTILLVEQFPLVAIIMKELVGDLYPDSTLSIITSLAEVDNHDPDMVIADMYGDGESQVTFAQKLCSRFPTQAKVFITDTEDYGFAKVIEQAQGLLVSRKKTYREIASQILDFDKGNRTDLHLDDSRNEFQSNIQHPGADKPLTLKQASVMELCAKGMTSKEIARDLSLSPETVRAHLRSAYVRLDASSRAEAVKNFMAAKRMCERLS